MHLETRDRKLIGSYSNIISASTSSSILNLPEFLQLNSSDCQNLDSNQLPQQSNIINLERHRLSILHQTKNTDSSVANQQKVELLLSHQTEFQRIKDSLGDLQHSGNLVLQQQQQRDQQQLLQQLQQLQPEKQQLQQLQHLQRQQQQRNQQEHQLNLQLQQELQLQQQQLKQQEQRKEQLLQQQRQQQLQQQQRHHQQQQLPIEQLQERKQMKLGYEEQLLKMRQIQQDQQQRRQQQQRHQQQQQQQQQQQHQHQQQQPTNSIYAWKNTIEKERLTTINKIMELLNPSGENRITLIPKVQAIEIDYLISCTTLAQYLDSNELLRRLALYTPSTE